VRHVQGDALGGIQCLPLLVCCALAPFPEHQKLRPHQCTPFAGQCHLPAEGEQPITSDFSPNISTVTASIFHSQTWWWCFWPRHPDAQRCCQLWLESRPPLTWVRQRVFFVEGWKRGLASVALESPGARTLYSCVL
jgi:hypothetical protein